MAMGIPEKIIDIIDATDGEKKVFNMLVSLLPDDYIVWYEPRISKRYADFVVLGPDMGLLVLEVKDWGVASVTKGDRHLYTLFGQINVRNPVEQARENMYALMDELKKDKSLIHPAGRNRGKIMFPMGHGVVLTRVERKEFDNSKIHNTMDKEALLFENELDYIINEEDAAFLLQKLKQMFSMAFPFGKLDEGEIDLIRARMFNEVLLHDNIEENIIATMDIQQEQLAKSLRGGHWVISGPVGSGKTVVLVGRVRFLAKNENEKFLVVCKNKMLANRLRKRIGRDNVEVYDFDTYINRVFALYLLPNSETRADILMGIIALEQHELGRDFLYNGVFIDEGNEFAMIELRFLVNRLENPETDDLLVILDEEKLSQETKEILTEAGIKTNGRVKYLENNYRNTEEIIYFAHEFIHDYETIESKMKPHVYPWKTLRSREPVHIYSSQNFAEEVIFLITEIKSLLKDIAPEDICVILPTEMDGDFSLLTYLTQQMKDYSLFYVNLQQEYEQVKGAINIATIDQITGMDFSYVFIMGLQDRWQQGVIDYRNSLFLAMTRAINKLYILCNENEALGRDIIELAKKVGGEAPDIVRII